MATLLLQIVATVVAVCASMVTAITMEREMPEMTPGKALWCAIAYASVLLLAIWRAW